MRIIDLSVPLSARCQERGKEGGTTIPQIEYVGHLEGGTQMAKIFDCSPNDFPTPGCGWAFEILTVGTHNGTHVDAPWHFSPTSDGKKSATIDQMPLEYCFGDGVVMRFTQKKAGEKIDIDDMKRELDRMHYTLVPGNIVYVNTGWDKYWGTSDYFYDKPGVTRDATLWLIDQGIHLMGTDSSGWDRSFKEQAKDFKRTGDRNYIWEGHFAGAVKPYYQIEKLANLDKLPDYGFKTCCIPINIEKAGAAWARPVAFLED
jgi:kynurenine formamidase